MPRIARVVLPGYPHHITQRGVRSMSIFSSDDDRREYLRLLAQQGRRFGVSFAAYCLMPNHVHLIAIPAQAASLARGIGEAHRLYTCEVNDREGVKGYLFQGRFYSCPLDERHLMASIRYIVRNPVRAGLAKSAWEYPWSSAAFQVGLRKSDPLLESVNPFGLVADWKELFAVDPDETAVLRKNIRSGRPSGEAGFMEKAEQLTGRLLRYQPQGRPRNK